jgi:leucyl aminopeptidase
MHPSFAKPAQNAIALHAVPAKDLKLFQGRIPYLKTSGFEARDGELRLVPDRAGTIEAAVLGLGKNQDPLALAAFSEQLPRGLYRLGDAPNFCGGEMAALAWLLGAYKFARYKKSRPSKARLVLPAGVNGDEIARIAENIFLARDLINTPSNDMGPQELAEAAERLARAHGAKFAVVEAAQLLKQNYPLIHAVGQGSARVPRLITLTWGNPKARKVTLVGKGVCFDTGGYNLKPGGGMATMKKDMGGAATVLAIAGMAMGAKLNLRLKVLIPAVENSVSGTAYRPGDVFKSR